MEEPKQQQSSSSPEGFDLEVFRNYVSITQQRVGLQNKCVEMSIQITSGLAVVVVGATIASIAKNSGSYEFPDLEKIRLPIIIIFGLYGLIQSLLLTNYIYHAVTVQGSSYIYGNVIRQSFKRVLAIDVRSKDKGRIKTRGLGFVKMLKPLVEMLQPLVVYSSAALGWLVVSCVLLFMRPAILPSYCAFAIVIILWFCFYLLFWLHKHAHDFAKELLDDSLDSDSSQQLPSNDANREKANETAV